MGRSVVYKYENTHPAGVRFSQNDLILKDYQWVINPEF